ncbi:MAG TPA: hypothetical protein VEC36_00365 [Patescibacteria group bacterium]|nr:hypothetical protein [Patescibacteria group bacterium]
MQYISFQDIKNDHLLGQWRLKDNSIGSSDPANPFATAERHIYNAGGVFILKSAMEKRGRWEIIYSDDLVKRPYLQFEVDSAKVLALITRLKCTEDCKKGQMTLYLTTGLELNLEKD